MLKILFLELVNHCGSIPFGGEDDEDCPRFGGFQNEEIQSTLGVGDQGQK